MDEKKQTGFTLFPTPPTPPAKRSRARTKSSSNSSAKLTKSRPGSGRNHGRKLSASMNGDAPQANLLPAPLKIRKASEDIPPLPAILPPLPPSTPTRTTATAVNPKTPEGTAPQLPSIRQSSPISPLPQTPARQLRAKSRTVAELIELDGYSKKRASSRLSQWLDLDDGEIDRKRLSRYLGSVLDNHFEIPTFEPKMRASLALSRRISRLELAALIESCECPPNTVICQCSSSPEFERFRSWSSHKANSSVSSTACLIGVPRARFQSNFFAITEPTIAEVPSPPGLAYDTEEEAAEALDWTGPLTPSKDDVFSTPSSSGNLRSIDYTLRSSQSWSWTPSKHQSFSRPFRPGSSGKSLHSDDSAPSTPSRSQSRSTAPRSGFLTSISTMSSFDFDFDIKARRQSLAKLQEFDFETEPQLLGEKEQTNHLRTDSNDSFGSQISHTSQYEVNTATITAPVAMTSSIVKPVLITKTPKRHNLPSSVAQPRPSLSISTKSSTSVVTVPEYWQQYDAGMRIHSRSTTVASTQTNESAAFSAMLTMPLLSPKLPQQAKSPVPGNAFAQRSNTAATMPPTLPRTEASHFKVGLSEPFPNQLLTRAETTPLTHTPPSPPIQEPAQAYANASARLKAYMDSCVDNSTPVTAEGKIGLGLKKASTKGRKKQYLCVDEQMSHRDDSGVFGRMSVLGTALGMMPGRREFSEPHFYRT